MDIITKFTVASDQGINVLLFLTQKLAAEKYAELLEPDVLAAYIANNFNKKALIAEINNMSNQWLVVYADDTPAGYVKITTKGQRPLLPHEYRRLIRIADFAVLQEYSTSPEIKQSLFDKCLSVCKSYEAIWINEYLSNSFIDFFESQGFSKHAHTSQSDEISLPSVCLIYLNDAGTN